MGEKIKNSIPVVTFVILGILFISLLLDTLVFAPAGTNVFTVENFFMGTKQGALTKLFELNTSDVLSGQIWRVFTSMFLHEGLIHLAFNSVMLLVLGWAAERILGRKKFLILYLGAGVISALSNMIITQVESGLGASTAIYGLGGALIVLFFTNRSALKLYSWVTAWIVIAFVIISHAIFISDPVLLTEHLGGVLGGALIAFIMYLVSGNNTKKSTVAA